MIGSDSVRRLFPWLLLLLLTACTYKPRVPDAVIACGGEASPCPDGFRCVALQSGQRVCCRGGICPSVERPDGATSGEAGATEVDGGHDAGADVAVEDDTAMLKCPGDACSPGASRCAGDKLEICVNVDECGKWAAGTACPDTQMCMGSAPNAKCECPAPPAGCEGGGGTRCESANVILTCMTSEAKCIVAVKRVTCPCTGTFPSASCSNCPPPPPQCQGRTGRSCNEAGQLVECVTDAQTCVSLAPAKACDMGRTCRGTFPDAACVCTALDVGQPCGKCGGMVKCDGSCSVETPANHGQSCSTCGGVFQCNGTCSVVTPPNVGMACGNCGGVTRCDGSCSIVNPPTFGLACGACGGVTRCDGSCSVPNPPNLGLSCGTCGGTTKCDGSCSANNSNGMPCGSCGGTLQCDGSCSIVAAPTMGMPCGGCNGVTKCDGSCSMPTPANLGVACGQCGGVIKCDGTCSVLTPPNVGTACGKCGGTVKCDGTCSVATPPNFGSACNVCGTITCAGTCSRATACALNEGLVLHWKFDEDALQTTAADSSPSRALSGVYVGSPPAVAPGAPLTPAPSPRCRSFSTAVASQAVIIPGGLPVGLKLAAPLTIATWYQASRIKPGNAGADLVSLGDNHMIRLLPDGFEGTKRSKKGNGAEWIQCLSKPARKDHLDGRWHHVAMTVDPTSMTVYFDGQAVCQKANDAPLVYDVPGELTVGRHGNKETTGNVDGSIDEVRIYGRSLAPAEIMSLAAGGN